MHSHTIQRQARSMCIRESVSLDKAECGGACPTPVLCEGQQPNHQDGRSETRRKNSNMLLRKFTRANLPGFQHYSLNFYDFLPFHRHFLTPRLCTSSHSAKSDQRQKEINAFRLTYRFFAGSYDQRGRACSKRSE